MQFERLLGRWIVPHLLALFHLPVTYHLSGHIPPPAESRGGWPLSSTPTRHSPPAETLGNCNSFDLHGFHVYFLSRHRFDLLLNTAKAKYFNPKS